MADITPFATPQMPDALVTTAYEKAATKSVMAAVNNAVFFGYFSVCADGKGHGHDTTFPGLDWGQSAEALLWLGRADLVRASWEYVKSFQREDGLLPFAIIPGQADKNVEVLGNKMRIEANGGIYVHWAPGNPFRTLAQVTYIQMADAIFRHTQDGGWLREQIPSLKRTVQWLKGTIDAQDLVVGGGHYLERPTRLEHDGVSQCYNIDAYRLAAGLFKRIGDAAAAKDCQEVAERLTAAFRKLFWAGDQCVEYLDPVRGPIHNHGLTDVDWIAVATRAASPEQLKVLWPKLLAASDFVYNGIPTGIATKPETYADWEISSDRHDISAMGRVWYLEAWARGQMRDADGLLNSLRLVAEAGKANDWYWVERYYSARTGDLSTYRFNTYVEYPACLIRIVNRFLLGIEYGLDGSLVLAPNAPDPFWVEGFGQKLAWGGRSLDFRFRGAGLKGSYTGRTGLRMRVRLRSAGETALLVNGQPAKATARDDWVEFDLPTSRASCSFELTGSPQG